MSRRSIVTAFASVALFTAFAAEAAQQVGWSVAPAGKHDPAGSLELRVSFTANGKSASTGAIRPLTDLAGLAPAALASATPAPVRFRTVSDAGTFNCSGEASNQRGAGTCDFESDPAFSSRLASLGIARPSGEEQLRMATQDVTLADAAAFRRLGYQLDAGRLIDLRIFRVTPAAARELTALGYTQVSLQTLIDLHIFKVPMSYVRELQQSGRRPALEEVIDRWRSRRR